MWWGNKGIGNDSTRFDPLSNDQLLLRRERVTDRGHMLFVGGGQGNSSQQLAGLGAKRSEDCGLQQTVAAVDAKVAILLLRPVTLQTVAAENGIDIADEADRRLALLRERVRGLKRQGQQQTGKQQGIHDAVPDVGREIAVP